MIHLFTTRSLVVLVILAITNTSCHKKTSSDFRLERYTYSPGETLDLINLSPKKRNQIWEILNPDGGSDTVVEGQAPQLTLNILGKDGMYKVRVFDNKKEKEKNVASEKSFMVSAKRGKVIIYSNSFASSQFAVYINNQKFLGGHLVSYQLPEGTHAIKASTVYYSGGPTHSLDTVVTIVPQTTTYLYLN